VLYTPFIFYILVPNTSTRMPNQLETLRYILSAGILPPSFGSRITAMAKVQENAIPSVSEFQNMFEIKGNGNLSPSDFEKIYQLSLFSSIEARRWSEGCPKFLT
jgi:hypothetical protein